MEYRDFVEELLHKTDLVGLISRYVRLTKKGNDYWGCCPFHNEKDASFKIYTSTNSYYCFGCKAAGNAITFLSEIESISRYDAVKLLAEQAGMEMPKNSFSKVEDKELVKKRERLYALMRDAAKYYHNNLLSENGKDAYKYLTERGITKRSITVFGLGASTSSTGVIEALAKKGYTLDEMKQAALIDNYADGWYDVYRYRVMFPIINIMGEVVSFSGRVLGKSDRAKYRNGAQSIIFDKSKNLYGINLAKKGKSILDYVIIVEGHIDAVSMYQAGFVTTVAGMGTALTTAQAKQLKNISSKIYISYDGDTAGQKATMRGLDILAEAGLNVKVVELPEGKDPDDVIRQDGKEKYQQLLQSALPLTSFKIKALSKKYDLGSQDGKADFAVEAVKIIKQLDNPIQQEEYLGQIHEMTGYSMAVLKQQAHLEDENKREDNVVNEQILDEKMNKIDKAIIFILASMLAKMAYVNEGEEIIDYLPEGFYKTVYETITSGRPITLLYSESTESEIKILNEIVNYNFMKGDDKEKYLNCITELKITSLNTKMEALARQYKETNDKTILAQINKYAKMINQMKRKEVVK